MCELHSYLHGTFVSRVRACSPRTTRVSRVLLTLDFTELPRRPCCLSWGHDFRPSYRQLKELRLRFPGVPVIAATATATKAVKDDIVSQLGLQAATVLQTSFDRPNLAYQVVYDTLL